MRALDLFCGAGGASAGLHKGGFTVIGVDLNPQPEYPFTFIRANALDFSLKGFDFVWASPPCQAFSAYRRRGGNIKPALNLIPAVRAKLRKWGGPYVIENVVGAPLKNPIMLCGSHFALDVRRHRLFEANFPIAELVCDHLIWEPRFTPASNRANLRKTCEIGVWRIPLEIQQKAMGIHWMGVKTLSQAIPPAYSRYIAEQFFKSRRKA